MQKIGILGTGIVGQTIGSKLLELGYQVMMGSRTSDNEKATQWAENNPMATHGTFSDAAAFGDLVFNCSKGEFTLDIVRSAGTENLRGKILIDVSNPLDFSKGFPPSLYADKCNTTSLGEQVQDLMPDTHVVKTLNIVNCMIMVDAKKLPENATMLLAGNNADAKNTVSEILKQFGWEDIVDLGNIQRARGMEMMLPVWVNLYGTFGHADFGFRIVR